MSTTGFPMFAMASRVPVVATRVGGNAELVIPSFDPTRAPKPHLALGVGLHFCVGAPLARLEMKIALQTLFRRCPKLPLAVPASYANLYHFHGLERLIVAA